MSNLTHLTNSISWQSFYFDQLSNHQLYQLLKLRTDIFVVEQHCPYPELDNHDNHPNTQHLLGIYDGKIIACARLLPANLTYPTPSIGRVAICAEFRSKGLGHELMAQALTQCNRRWKNESITIGAQYHLRHFYLQHQFKEISDPYDEDGILHIDMIREAL